MVSQLPLKASQREDISLVLWLSNDEEVATWKEFSLELLVDEGRLSLVSF